MNVTSTSNLQKGGGHLGKSIEELPKVMEYVGNQTDKKSSTMSRSLHTPGPVMRSKTPGRAMSDIFNT